MQSACNFKRLSSQWWLIVFLLIVPTAGVPQSQVQKRVTLEQELSGRDIAIRLPETRRIDITQISLQNARLISETVVVRRGNTVQELLSANGIYPDANVLSLIYDLNPDIDDINMIIAGTQIKLPEIEGEEFFETALARGYRVELTRDQTAVRELAARRAELAQITDQVSNIAASRFAVPDDKQALLETLKIAHTSMEIIGNTKFAVGRKVLSQAEVESRTAIGLLEGSISSNRVMNHDVVETVSAIGSFLNGLSLDILAGGSGQVRTTIRTLNSLGKHEPSLRVWYKLDRRGSTPEDCDEASSPSRETITRGDYIFWATSGESPNDRVTDEVRREIRRQTKDDPVDLRFLLPAGVRIVR